MVSSSCFFRPMKGDALVEASVALHLAAALGSSTKLEEE